MTSNGEMGRQDEEKIEQNDDLQGRRRPSGMLDRLLPGRNGGSVLALFGIETRVCDGASGVCVKLQRAPAKRYRLRTKANEAVVMLDLRVQGRVQGHGRHSINDRHRTVTS